GGVDSLGHPDGDRLAGKNQAVVDDGTFRAAEAAEHVSDGIGVALVADADPQPGKLVGSQVSCDVPQALLSSVGPAGPDPDLSHGQAQVIANGQDLVRLELVEADCLADATAAQVHEGFGLQQQDTAKVDFCLGHLTVELASETGAPSSAGQPVDELEPHVVASSLVLRTGIAQTDHQFRRRQGSRSRLRITRSHPCRAGDRVLPSVGEHDCGQSAFSFSLRSGLITSGWVTASAAAASAVGSAVVPRTTTCTMSKSPSEST